MLKYAFALIPIFIGIGFWLKDGARLSFWANHIEVRDEIPVIEGMPELGTLTKVTWIDQFVCGVETPLISLLVSFLILFFQIYFKRSLKNYNT